ncbi:unnamed protein product, partial [Cylicocyclus nassatus]
MFIAGGPVGLGPPKSPSPPSPRGLFWLSDGVGDYGAKHGIWSKIAISAEDLLQYQKPQKWELWLRACRTRQARNLVLDVTHISTLPLGVQCKRLSRLVDTQGMNQWPLVFVEEDRSQMVSVLLAHAHEDEPPLGRKLALIWMDEFIRIYKETMLPYLSSYLTAILPSLDCDALK